MKLRIPRVFLVSCVAAATLLPALPGNAGPPTLGRTIGLSPVTPGVRGALSASAARARRGMLLPSDPVALAAAKASSTPTRFGSSAPTSTAAAPISVLGKNGLASVGTTPSDSTGAVGPTRYIENVNSQVGIYDRSLNLLGSDTLNTWYGQTGADSFDPQVIWDATTKRFYYAGDSVFSASDNRLSFGFSTTQSPTNLTTDWCHYQIGYGANFPDYPKLGDSKFFTIIGVNTFGATSFIGSDIIAVGKPPVGTTCPSAASFAFGKASTIKVGTSRAFTPVPANEIDGNGTGYVLTRGLASTNTAIGHFTVKRNATTLAPVIQSSGSAITVPSYSIPPAAAQKGSIYTIDTSDARLTQAVAALDPGHAGRLAIWTQHTVSGGAGAQVRWYEIDAVAKTVLQSGSVSDASRTVFNGAISPDRVALGSVKAFGQNMVLSFNTSSSTTFPAIAMVSKRGTGAVSAWVNVVTSPGPMIDFACPSSGECRWGDYAAATPDPKASVTGAVGVVWLTSMWTADGNTTGGTSGTSWRTWNWAAAP